MKIEGIYDVKADRGRVWAALLDPEMLTKTMPGCEKLEEVGPGRYKATLTVGIAAIQGTYEGRVELRDLDPPARYTMTVEGSGSPGFVRGDAVMELSDVEGGTRVSFTANVQMGGLIAGVGQRLIGGVAKMLADQFFSRMAEQIQGGP